MCMLSSLARSLAPFLSVCAFIYVHTYTHTLYVCVYSLSLSRSFSLYRETVCASDRVVLPPPVRPGTDIHPDAQVRTEIDAQTVRLVGDQKNVSDKPIHLRIYSPHVLNLTMVDLPGAQKGVLGVVCA